MSNDLNLCTFIGRLGKDPESKAMPSGTEVCDFSIAVGWKFKDKEGTEWVNVTTFGGLAGVCSQYLRKGSQVMISGRMRTESWEKDGQKHYKTKIVADNMQMLGKSEGDQKPAWQGEGKKGEYSGTFSGGGTQQSAPAFSGGDDFSDKIPFNRLTEHG